MPVGCGLLVLITGGDAAKLQPRASNTVQNECRSLSMANGTIGGARFRQHLYENSYAESQRLVSTQGGLKATKIAG